MIKDFFLLVFRNFTRRKLRGWLTILGILIGIAAVVALISISQGLENAIKEQFETMGTNKIMIMPGAGMMGMGFGETTSKIMQDDFETIKDVSGVDMLAGYVYSNMQIKYKDEIKYALVIGVPLDESRKLFEEMEGFEIEKGNFIKKGYEANIGWLLAEDTFFEKKVLLRDKIFLDNEEFKVTGTIKRIGNRQDDSQIYIPLETARELFGKEEEFDMLLVQIKQGYDVDKVSDKIKQELRDLRDEEEGAETFQVTTFEQMLEKVGTILGIVRVILIAIAAISLLVGGIGVMNTMYTGVLERTREIGIMKAIGARNSDIMAIFLIESGFYGLIGGVAGVILGFGLSKTAEIIASHYLGTTLIKASFAWWLILGALGFSFIIGCISGVAPARQASKLKPVDALRYE